MTDKEKLEKLKKLADAMYYAAQYLTTDASGLHKAMDEYHQFIIHEYHKEEPTIPDIVDEHWWEMLGEEPVSEDLDSFAIKYAQDKPYPVTVCQAVKVGANWQKQKNESKVLTEEQCRKIRDDAFELGKDAMKQQMMKEAVICVVEPRYKKEIGRYLSLDIVMNEQNYKVNDRVKILVIKED